MKRLPFFVSAVLVVVMGAASSAAAARPRVVKPSPVTTLTIGGLFALTGDGATLGNASEAALEIAARDINQELAELHLPYIVTTVVEDSKLTASVAAERLPFLVARGATIVIGPQSSSEAAAVLDYVNSHGILLISQGSTASSLAIPGDNLFRLAPNDKLEGAAMAALMVQDGVSTIVPMWRDDAGNRGLHDSTKRSLEALGGSVSAGVSYAPSTTDFASSVTALGNAVRAVRAQTPAAKVGVYLASFEEAVAIFQLARLDSDLAGVRWYGGDGVTQSQALIANANAAAFAVTTNFTAPNVGLDEQLRDRWEPLSAEIKSRVGFDADAYSLSVYDAAWVAALSAVEAQLRSDSLKASFVNNIQRYWGVTGPTALDDAGDRKIGNFDFWTVRTTNGQTQWIRTAQYTGGHVSH